MKLMDKDIRVDVAVLLWLAFAGPRPSVLTHAP